MFFLILFLLLAAQRLTVETMFPRGCKSELLRIKRQANLGLWLLGAIAIIDVTLNIVMHRGWWESDFFSPFFTGFNN